MIIDTVPVGTNLRVKLNGRSLGIVESNPEWAFAYWALRNHTSSPDRRFTLHADNGVNFALRDGQWRAA